MPPRTRRQIDNNPAAGPDVVKLEHRQISFSGPLPPPQVLEQYNAVIPGSAERILSMAEKQSEHRMALEKIAVQGESRRAFGGLITGFLISLAAFGVALTLGLESHDVLAGTIAIADIATLAGVFVYGTNVRKKERIEKTKLLSGNRE